MLSCCLGGGKQRPERETSETTLATREAVTSPPITDQYDQRQQDAIKTLPDEKSSSVAMQKNNPSIKQQTIPPSAAAAAGTSSAIHNTTAAILAAAAVAESSASSSVAPPRSCHRTTEQNNSSDPPTTTDNKSATWERQTGSDAVSSTEALDSVHSLGVHASSYQYAYRPVSPPPFLAGSPRPLSSSASPLLPTASHSPSSSRSLVNNDSSQQSSHKALPISPSDVMLREASASTRAPQQASIHVEADQIPQSSNHHKGMGYAASSSSENRRGGGISASPSPSPSPSPSLQPSLKPSDAEGLGLAGATSISSHGSLSSNSLDRACSMQSQGGRARSTMVLGPSLLGRSLAGSVDPNYRPLYPQTHTGLSPIDEGSQGGGQATGGGNQQHSIGILRNTIIENLNVKSQPLESPSSKSSRGRDSESPGSGGRGVGARSSPNPQGSHAGSMRSCEIGLALRSQSIHQMSAGHNSSRSTDPSLPSNPSGASSFIMAN